jgi:type IV pilus assembly protein PilE
MKNAKRGFTLIELMITVALVAILTAVALPSYQSHVRKSRRAEAQAFLLSVAARQQQFLLDTRGFATTLTAVGIATPSNVSAAYTVQLCTTTTPCTALAAGATAFALIATPDTAQSSEKCGTLSIDQNGTKTAAVSGCW